MTQALWTPTDAQIAQTKTKHYLDTLNKNYNLTCQSMDDLHAWSIANKEDFWQSIWDYCGVIASKPASKVFWPGKTMRESCFFKDAELNFAENLLRKRGPDTALVFWGEDKLKRKLSFDDLYEKVSLFAQALKAQGVKPGDRVAAVIPNTPEAVIGMLATASIGAVWSSCSPDFGVQGIVDRFGQIAPKILICVEGYYYNGKWFDMTEKLEGVEAAIPAIEKIIVVPYDGAVLKEDFAHISKSVSLKTFTTDARPAQTINFAQMPFNHPLYIMFSSGTTGAPKCIVHGAGGTLIQHLKEHQIHSDVRPGDRVFYFTTCGWMMWNWLVSALASEATLLLYDGSPFAPDGNILFDYAQAEKMTLFGTAAKYIDALEKAAVRPKNTHDLSSIRVMTSTGSPLSHESFQFVYDHIKSDLCLSSISGGTDIVSCFALGNPIGSVYSGELQTRGLGMDVRILDDEGASVTAQKGELTCHTPFPCQPIYFWNDPDEDKFKSAYFSQDEQIWFHGDYVELTNQKGMIFYGRSDAVLNPGGVRIGTAEIYRQVQLVDEVLESIAVGQDWDSDVRVVLFVKLRENIALTEKLSDKIKHTIRQNTTPRHVPAKVVSIADIPRTKSGKIVEIAVRDAIHGKKIKNKEALSNPEAIDLYYNISDLSE